MGHVLPPLPYPTDALEPTISKRIMELHHGKHHAAYVAGLEQALAGHADLAGLPVDDLLRRLSTVPEAIRTAVRNHGGGHSNHAMFWTIMSPKGGGTPGGALAKAIDGAFGSFATFQERFQDAGMKRFGSGWAWLVAKKGGTLEIVSSANQDSPLSDGHEVVLGNDVWEHAYYLTYENRRADYLKAWWKVVDWKAVEARFQKFAAK